MAAASTNFARPPGIAQCIKRRKSRIHAKAGGRRGAGADHLFGMRRHFLLEKAKTCIPVMAFHGGLTRNRRGFLPVREWLTRPWQILTAGGRA